MTKLDPREITAETVCPSCGRAGYVYATGYVEYVFMFRPAVPAKGILMGEDKGIDPDDAGGDLGDMRGWKCVNCKAEKSPE